MIKGLAVARASLSHRGGVPASAAVVVRVEEDLRSSGYHALGHVVCQDHEGVIILHGHVPSFYMKQLAQVVAGKVPGVARIVNRLVVDDNSGGP